MHKALGATIFPLSNCQSGSMSWVQEFSQNFAFGTPRLMLRRISRWPHFFSRRKQLRRSWPVSSLLRPARQQEAIDRIRVLWQMHVTECPFDRRVHPDAKKLHSGRWPWKDVSNGTTGFKAQKRFDPARQNYVFEPWESVARARWQDVALCLKEISGLSTLSP